MDRWRGKVAVVTGASAGIGLATVKALVCEGMIVVGLARRQDKMLKEMSSVKGPGKFYARKCDVSKETDVIETFEYIKKTFKTLHILINNAGIIKMNSIEESNMEDLRQVIDVNLMGALYCAKYGIKLIKENNNEAHIVNINSVAGHNVPNVSSGGKSNHFNVYPATKYALTALSQILSNELLGGKIRVTNLSPGLVLTEIFEEATDLIASGLLETPALKSEDIADSIIYVIGTPPHVQITQLTISPLGSPF